MPNSVTSTLDLNDFHYWKKDNSQNHRSKRKNCTIDNLTITSARDHVEIGSDILFFLDLRQLLLINWKVIYMYI